jgi:hypothetical protein
MVGGSPASSTTKTGPQDIAEILLKVTLKHQKSKSKIYFLKKRSLIFSYDFINNLEYNFF